MPDHQRSAAAALERERAERALRESEQTLADLDQTQSESDQQHAERDQTASDLDQELSDRDQHASDRDQVAADWQSAYSVTSSAAGEAHDRSRLDRDVGGVERSRTSRARARIAVSRAQTACRRDDLARLRDAASEKRDQIAQARDDDADARDRAAEQRERRTDGGALPSQLLDELRELRERSRELRHQSALERLRAAADREAAAEDRRHAAHERRLTGDDELTGALLRGAGEAALAHEIARARHRGHTLAISIVGLDGLAAVNEAHGHAAGDALLRHLAAAISTALHPYDLVVRWGGDEFLLAIPESTTPAARQRVAAIQQAPHQPREHRDDQRRPRPAAAGRHGRAAARARPDHARCRQAITRTLIPVPRSDRPFSIPSGLADRIDRVRDEQEPFEHWVRHQLEAAVLREERAQGLVSAQQGDQIATQAAHLEEVREHLDETLPDAPTAR